MDLVSHVHDTGIVFFYKKMHHPKDRQIETSGKSLYMKIFSGGIRVNY